MDRAPRIERAPCFICTEKASKFVFGEGGYSERSSEKRKVRSKGLPGVLLKGTE